MISQRCERHSKNIRNLEELRELIEKYDSWGDSLNEFQEKAGHRQENNIKYYTDFYWGSSSSGLQEQWELIQYIHKYYESSHD